MRSVHRLVVAAGLLALAGHSVSATPVATTPQQAAVLGRVFVEPLKSTNYIQYDPKLGTKELDGGFTLLSKTYPRYISYSTVAKELHDPRAVSSGGNPLQVITVTDRTVPDTNKQYVLLTFAHSAETCGREGVLRSAEDLALAATKAPATKYDDGSVNGVRHAYTVRDLLQRLKIVIVVTSPDGWKAGEFGNSGVGYSQNTAAGINSNRVAYQAGWVFSTPLLKSHGYTTATQPEGISVTRYLRHLRDTEMHGRPFAVAADLHGPFPTGAILIHDVGDDPAKRERLQELAQRVRQRMNGVLDAYATHQGASTFSTAASYAESVRSLLVRFGMGPVIPDLVQGYPLTWAEESDTFDLMGYTVSSTWGQFMNDDHVGLGADAITYEINCVVGAPWEPNMMQLFVDNVRAIVQTTLVHAAALPALKAKPAVVWNLRGRVGYFDNGSRVTSRDGVGSQVPRGYPNVPLLKQLRQAPYDVSQTDFFRELGKERLLTSPLTRVTASTLTGQLPHLDTLVFADQAVPSNLVAPLRVWVAKGGNLVVTDSAIKVLAKLGLTPNPSALKAQFKTTYVGYSDINHGDAYAAGIPASGRELYDPVGLGFELNMNRDPYWTCPGSVNALIMTVGGGNNCPSGTKNTAPMWVVPSAAVTAIKGARVVGTVDPPATPSTLTEGAATTLSNIGVIPVGSGRVSYFGSLLPRPTEAYPHFFGLFGSTITLTGQTMLLHAMTWRRP